MPVSRTVSDIIQRQIMPGHCIMRWDRLGSLKVALFCRSYTL